MRVFFQKLGVCFSKMEVSFKNKMFLRKWEFVFLKMGVCFLKIEVIFENVEMFFENGSL